jgi:hypothetical protein
VPIDDTSAVDYEKTSTFSRFSFRAELRADHGFFGTHRGDQALFKKFFLEFFLQKFREWVIEVGDPEYRKKFRGLPSGARVTAV